MSQRGAEVYGHESYLLLNQLIKHKFY